MRWLKLLGVILLVCICVGWLMKNSIWLKVVNENNDPVPSVHVQFFWSENEPWGPSLHSGTQRSMDKISDSKGLVHVRIFENFCIGVFASDPGYYSETMNIIHDDLRIHTAPAKALVLQLKQIRNPQNLIAKKANIILPARTGRAGYDFLVGDLVTPYGKGHHEDMLINWSYDSQKNGYEERILWDLCFTPNSGIQTKRVSSKSYLKSDINAPLEGYLPSLRLAEQEANHGERGPREFAIYYFRLQRPDKILYGKIINEPEIIFYDSGQTVIKLIYAINPTGSRSMEPDMKHVTFPKQNAWEEPYSLPE